MHSPSGAGATRGCGKAACRLTRQMSELLGVNSPEDHSEGLFFRTYRDSNVTYSRGPGTPRVGVCLQCDRIGDGHCFQLCFFALPQFSRDASCAQQRTVGPSKATSI